MNIFKKYSHRIILISLFCLSFLLIFSNLGKQDLGHYREESHKNSLSKNLEWLDVSSDFLKSPMHYNYLNYHEYRYSTVVQEILENNEWRTLTVKNMDSTMPYYMKGPVYFWLTALTAKIFGFSKFVVRFWPALFGFLTIILTYFLTKNIFGKRVGLFSVFILSSTLHFIYIDGARAVAIDTTFLFFVLLSIYLLFKQTSNTLFTYLSAFFIGIAALTRSVFVVIPLIIVFSLIYFFVHNKVKFRKKLIIYIVSILIILSVVVPWMSLQYKISGVDYIKDIERFQIKEEFLSKANLVDNAMYDGFQYSLFANDERPLDWNFYIWTIFKGFFPWSIFVLISLIYVIKICVIDKNKKLLSLLSVVSILYVFVSIKEQNWSRYAINFYPFLSIFVAKLLYDFYKNKKDDFLRIGFLLTFLFFSPFLVPYNFSYPYLVTLYVVALSLLLIGYFIVDDRRNIKLKIITSLIILHFCVIAVLNVLQPL